MEKWTLKYLSVFCSCKFDCVSDVCVCVLVNDLYLNSGRRNKNLHKNYHTSANSVTEIWGQNVIFHLQWRSQLNKNYELKNKLISSTSTFNDTSIEIHRKKKKWRNPFSDRTFNKIWLHLINKTCIKRSKTWLISIDTQSEWSIQFECIK